MSARKPPVLADWLMDRLGALRHNAPLAGDLLEEFRAGRSAGWYWRQTLAIIVTGLGRNARLFRRLLTAQIIGWAAETAVTFALWRFNAPPRLHGAAEPVSAVAVAILTFLVLFSSSKHASKCSPEVIAEKVRFWSSRDYAAGLQRTFLIIDGCGTCIAFLVCYCAIALFYRMSLATFVVLQAEWFLIGVMRSLANPNPTPSMVFTTVKLPSGPC